MLGDITAADEIYIVTGRTDMRKSIDGLCSIVEEQSFALGVRWICFYINAWKFRSDSAGLEISWKVNA